MGDAQLVDGGGVHVVDVVAGVEDGGHEFGGDEALHLVGDGDVAGGEGGLGVVFGEEDGDVVGGLALAEEPTGALEVLSDVRHDGEPGIVGVEDGGGVEAPAGLSGGGRGVGPAVADDLVDAGEEHAVGFDLHVERSGAEGWGVEPGEGFGGGDVAVVEVAGGAGPAGEGELTPLGAFSFGESGDGFISNSNCW